MDGWFNFTWFRRRQERAFAAQLALCVHELLNQVERAPCEPAHVTAMGPLETSDKVHAFRAAAVGVQRRGLSTPTLHCFIDDAPVRSEFLAARYQLVFECAYRPNAGGGAMPPEAMEKIRAEMDTIR